MATIKEGVTPRLANNNWYNDNIKPRMQRAYYIEADDGFHYQLTRTRNPRSGRVSILIAKVASSGFIKAMMSVAPDVAAAMGEKLKELGEMESPEAKS